VHPNFSCQPSAFSLFLHKQTYSYFPATFEEDGTGVEVFSTLGLHIHPETDSSNYILDIVSHTKIINTTTLNLVVNWAKNQDVVNKELSPGEALWVNPWIIDQVTIRPNASYPHAEPHTVPFGQPEGLYELSINNQAENDVYNYCCLTIEKEFFEVDTVGNSQHGSTDKKMGIEPGVISIKPTHFVVNHFHSLIVVNNVECPHKKKVPILSMYRSKNNGIFMVKFGDGSSH
jgi:hypothetical protein